MSSDRRGIPDFPDLDDRAVRFLYHERHHTETASITDLCRARIRGIDFEDHAREWIGVANALHQRGHLSDPTYHLLVDLLRERLEWLEDHGDRDERMARQGRREIDQKRIEAKRQREVLDRTTTAKAKLARLRADGGRDEGGESG